jgi:hypothetical protein
LPSAERLERLTIARCRASTIDRWAAREQRKTLFRLTSITASQSASSSLKRRSSRGDAGVVDEDVGPPVSCRDAGEQLADGGIGDVGLDRLRPSPRRHQRLDGCGDRPVAIGEGRGGKFLLGHSILLLTTNVSLAAY